MSRETELEIERQLQDAGLDAPRLTPADIDGKIKDVTYHQFPYTTVMVCALTLENGFVVLGESAAASSSNFNAAIGRKIAFEKAREKIWALEGYLLRERLFRSSRGE